MSGTPEKILEHLLETIKLDSNGNDSIGGTLLAVSLFLLKLISKALLHFEIQNTHVGVYFTTLSIRVYSFVPIQLVLLWFFSHRSVCE